MSNIYQLATDAEARLTNVVFSERLQKVISAFNYLSYYQNISKIIFDKKIPTRHVYDLNSRVAFVQKLLVSDTARRLVKREMQQKYVGGADGNSHYKI